MINTTQKAQLKRRLKRLHQQLHHEQHCMIAREKILSPALQESVDKLLARTTPAKEKKSYIWEGKEYTEAEFHKAVKAVNSDNPCIVLPYKGEVNSSEK